MSLGTRPDALDGKYFRNLNWSAIARGEDSRIFDWNNLDAENPAGVNPTEVEGPDWFWVGIPGILEIGFRTPGLALQTGAFFVELIKLVNIPSLTSVDDEYLEQHYEDMKDLAFEIPIVGCKIFGIHLSDFLPIHELKAMNKEGKPGSVPKLILYFIVILLFVVITAYLGKEIGTLFLTMIPGVASFVAGQVSAINTKNWRNSVDLSLDAIKQDLEELTGPYSPFYIVIALLKELLGPLSKLQFI